MEIRYKYIQDERTEDAPFVGALISAIGCHLKCRGCFNKHVKTYPTLTNTAEEIIALIKSNPFNEGIILGGLEWSEQPLEMIELCRVANENGLKVMIYTGLELGEFEERIGRACAESTHYAEIIKPYILTPDDNFIYQFIGTMVLDNTITEDYYIKAGRYDRDKKSTDRKAFGVSLASDNQIIIKFAKAQDE